MHRQIDLCREIADENSEGTGYYVLGSVLAFAGQWEESEKALNAGEEIKKKTHHIQAQGVILSYRALRFLLMARSNPQSSIVNCKSAIECAQRALDLAEGGDPNIGGAVVPRDLVRSHWLLGAAYLMNNELTLAEENLSKALNLCRQINNVESEADILLDVARLRYAQRDFKDAQEKASEALVITERCGYVLQSADVNNFLAELALAWGEKRMGNGEWRMEDGGEEVHRRSKETGDLRWSAVLLQGGV